MNHSPSAPSTKRAAPGGQVLVVDDNPDNLRVRKTERVDAAPGGDERILLVDDEPILAQVIKRMLDGLGYRTEMETNSIVALERFRRTPDAFDVVITDLTIPEMTGDELARGVSAIRPDLPIILCTGYSETITAEELPEAGVDKLLLKPVISSKLAKAVREAVDE